MRLSPARTVLSFGVVRLAGGLRCRRRYRCAARREPAGVMAAAPPPNASRWCCSFVRRTCPFCREVEELYLGPRERDAGATPRILLRAVDIDGAEPLVTFDGRRTDHAGFAREQRVNLVPHLRFLGPDGQALAPDLIGISSRDFYGGYLEDAIKAASDRLRSPQGRPE
ncbi:MAG: hypothetical protein MZV65_52785 [Chromatiales bacterium]|nr:hypothetical protein [Chromatiales bacterium]